MSDVAEFTEENFETEVINSEQTVLVDFWATWCGPCRQLTPVIHELADDNSGSARIGKVDIDANRQIAEKYGISSIPTLMILEWEIVEKLQGVQPKGRLQQAIDAATA